MSVAILDIIILSIFALGFIYGLKKGFINGIISLVGLVIIVVLSFLFKGLLASTFMNIFPFFKFSGAYKGIYSLNILLYEGIAFFLIFAFLLSILSLIMKFTGIVQKIIDLSIVLTLPSKILGVLTGLFNAIIVVFVMLFILLNINKTRKMVYDSKIASFILERTFILSSVTSNEYLSAEEINDVIHECKNHTSVKTCNTNMANVLIKYNIVEKEKVIELNKKGKLKNINKEDLYDKVS